MKEENRIGPFFQTYLGHKFYPLDPRPNDIHIEDIAHALTLKCRFGGHCTRFYSVAEHCIRMVDALETIDGIKDENVLINALLHDAAEAYIPDFLSPMKDQWMWMGYPIGPSYTILEIENKIMNAIFEKFSLERLDDPVIKIIENADLRMLATEKEHITMKSFEWGSCAKIPLYPWRWRVVSDPDYLMAIENEFLRIFYQLANL